MSNRFFLWAIISILGFSCTGKNLRNRFPSAGNKNYSGTDFYNQAKHFNWQQRDSLAMLWYDQGAIPSWWKRFKRITIKAKDSSGKHITLKYWVSPDYLVLGNKEDWVRVPVTPMAAQYMMDKAGAVFPTSKMTDQIFDQAKLRLNPMPMVAFRDSSQTMYQHHLIIEGQRKGRKGLIAGIKKDVVTTYKIAAQTPANRVAIYGWHYPDGSIIQPLYAGHVNWYVDYSHGIRFVYNSLRVNGRTITLNDALQNAAIRALLCKEDTCGYFRYPKPAK